MNHLLQPLVQSPADFAFFRLILEFLEDRIDKFGSGLLQSLMQWVGGIALTVMTFWVLIQGYRIVVGQSRDSMMSLVFNTGKAGFIIAVATTMGMAGHALHDILATQAPNEITRVVTGSNDSAAAQIDKSLAWMQVAMSSLDALDTAGDMAIEDAKARSMLFVGLGSGGPALIGGTLLLMYQIALALFVGLGPLFILCLLFDATKQLFWRWLWYGIGTMFSMAVLAAMVSIALDMVIRVAAVFWANGVAGQIIGYQEGMSSQAMQQGGIGVILTLLIVTTPMMAANFFQGAVGSMMHYSAFSGAGGSTSPGPQGQPVTAANISSASGSTMATGQAELRTQQGTRTYAPSQAIPDEVKEGRRNA